MESHNILTGSPHDFAACVFIADTTFQWMSNTVNFIACGLTLCGRLTGC